jgi:hypothetical protein
MLYNVQGNPNINKNGNLNGQQIVVHKQSPSLSG